MLFRKKVKAPSEIMKKPLEHSVMPALDYHFAIERYTESDCRYLFVQFFSTLFLERTGVEVFNCKIDIPKVNIPKKNLDLVRQKHPKINSIYNICVYVKTPKCSVEKIALDNSLLLEIHKKAITEYPVKALGCLELNIIKIIDFSVCAKAFAISQSIGALRKELKIKYSCIEDVIAFDEVVCIIYKKNKMPDSFLVEKNKIELKDFASNIIKRYDFENVCSNETLKYILIDNKKYNAFGFYRDGINNGDGIVL